MLRTFIITLVSLFFCSGHVKASDKEMPIIAYMGVPDWKTSDEDFKTLSECGFNVSLYPYTSVELMIKACRCADKYGVKILGQPSALYTDVAGTVKSLKDEPGLFGYFLWDEPNVTKLQELKSLAEAVKSHDSSHRIFIDLLPCYDLSGIPSLTKAKSYEDYVKTFDSIPCQQLSFDYYPVTKDQGVRKLWYYNLEVIRNRALATNRPFWGFALAVPHANYPTPTLETLRLQVYSNLAYGAQAIEYFTYWTPGKNEGYDYHDAPVDHEGNKTPTYAIVQQMNRELRKIAPLFYGAKVTAVSHVGEDIPHGTTKLNVMPHNIRKLSVSGGSGAIVSQFTKSKHKYLAVVNKDYKSPLQLHIVRKNGIPRRVNGDLTLEKMRRDYSIPAGGMLVFRLR